MTSATLSMSNELTTTLFEEKVRPTSRSRNLVEIKYLIAHAARVPDSPPHGSGLQHRLIQAPSAGFLSQDRQTLLLCLKSTYRDSSSSRSSLFRFFHLLITFSVIDARSHYVPTPKGRNHFDGSSEFSLQFCIHKRLSFVLSRRSALCHGRTY